MNVNVLGTKTRGSKGLISYKIENGIFAIKKMLNVNILTLLVCILVRLHYDIVQCSINPKKKTSQKIFKIEFEFYFTIFGLYHNLQNSGSRGTQTFIDNLVLLVVMGLLPLSTNIESEH